MNAKLATLERHDERRLPASESSRTRRWTALIERIAAGDLDACATLYDESATFAFSLIVQMLQDRETADAALVDLYVDIQNEARTYHGLQTPLAWVMALARRSALARLRRSTPSGHHLTATSTSVASLAEATRRTRVVAFDSAHRQRHHRDESETALTQEQRSILRLVYYGGLSAREVATHLGLRLPYVVEQIHSAMQLLGPIHRAG